MEVLTVANQPPSIPSSQKGMTSKTVLRSVVASATDVGKYMDVVEEWLGEVKRSSGSISLLSGDRHVLTPKLASTSGSLDLERHLTAT